MPFISILLLGLLFFAPLVFHPDHLLYSDHSDFLALELPGVRFQAQTFRTTGELPKWCPYSFAGRGFVSTPYPLVFPFVVTDGIPESALGPLLCWMMIFHIVVAGLGMYVYARDQKLGEVGAFVAACGFMFGGAWLLHILAGGHFFVGFAWLPFVMLYLERAIRRRSLTAGTLAAVFYALLVWGLHPQISFYAGLLIALWALGTSLQEAGYLGGIGVTSRKRTAQCLALCVGCGLWTAGLGVALAGAQLLPMFGSAAGSTRAGGVSASDLLMLGRLTVFNLVGPSVQEQPRWEECGGLGLIAFFLALAAPVLSPSKLVRYRAAVCGLLFLFALGGLVVQGLPAFNLFRQPARMFVVVGFPIAYLAGTAVDALLARPGPAVETRQIGRFILMVTAILVGMLLWAWIRQLQHDEQTLRIRPYWFALAVTLPATFWLLGEPRLPRAWLAGGWIAVVLMDLWSLVGPQVQTRPEAEVYPISASVAYLTDHRANLGRVLDVDQRPVRGTSLAENDDPASRSPTRCSPLGRGAPLAFFLEIQPVRGYSPVDIARYKMFLQFVGDSDEPLVALRDHLAFPIVCNVAVKNPSLLDLLGTRYLLMPADMLAPPGWHKVLDDPTPHAFDVATGGMSALDEYVLYENPSTLPRAFVVPNAEALQEAEALAQLKATDFRKTALLEGPFPALPASSDGSAPRPATVTRYTPNEVVVHCESGLPGYLVLTDPWYPGWVCHVNGAEESIYRADYAFRGVALPAEACDIVFRFAPAAYPRGIWLTGSALAVVVIVMLLAWKNARMQPPRTP